MHIPFLHKKKAKTETLESTPGKYRLIVGLGNPGLEYSRTRHNAGFMFLDEIARQEFLEDKKFKAEIAKQGSKYLAKPTTYMNKSGEAVQLIKNFYKLENSEILVVYDDLDIEGGKYKIQQKGPHVHNGVNSVYQHIGDGFNHLRIGIDFRTPEIRKNIKGVDYVLGKFTDQEYNTIEQTFKNILEENSIL